MRRIIIVCLMGLVTLAACDSGSSDPTSVLPTRVELPTGAPVSTQVVQGAETPLATAPSEPTLAVTVTLSVPTASPIPSITPTATPTSGPVDLPGIGSVEVLRANLPTGAAAEGVSLRGIVQADPNRGASDASSTAMILFTPDGVRVEFELLTIVAEQVIGQEVMVSGLIAERLPEQGVLRIFATNVSATGSVVENANLPVVPGGLVTDGQPAAAITALAAYDALMAAPPESIAGLDWVLASGDGIGSWRLGFYQREAQALVSFLVHGDGRIDPLPDTPIFLITTGSLLGLDRAALTVDSSRALEVAEANGINPLVAAPALVLWWREDSFAQWRIDSPQISGTLVIDAVSGEATIEVTIPGA